MYDARVAFWIVNRVMPCRLKALGVIVCTQIYPCNNFILSLYERDQICNTYCFYIVYQIRLCADIQPSLNQTGIIEENQRGNDIFTPS